MPKNSHLNLARKLKRDEFYTCRSTVEDELRHYTKHFKGKTVLCNCDDDEYSEFFKYFQSRFDVLGLKKLIGVHYENEKGKPSYKLELYKDTNKDGVVNFKDKIIKTPIYGNDEYPAGDFRSRECIELLKEADIIVTNPPFSLWRNFLAQLMEYNKKFLIIGKSTHISAKEVFPLVKKNKIWLGVSIRSGAREFKIPYDYDISISTGNRLNDRNTRYIKIGGVRWFTNLKTAYKQPPLDMREIYYTPEKYPKYDNYDAINVDKVADIPCDYPGIMGVPLTFMDKYCPKQFEIVGDETSLKISGGRGYVKGKRKYARVFLRNKHPVWSNRRLCTGCIPGLIAYETVIYNDELQNLVTIASLNVKPIKLKKKIPGTDIYYEKDRSYKPDTLKDLDILDSAENSFKWSKTKTNVTPNYSLAGDFVPTFTGFTGFAVSKQL